VLVDREDDNLGEAPRGPSKSQRKREASALQDIGVRLVALSPTRLQALPLPDELLEAVRAAQGMHQHGAHRRQLQYIGKLMRRIDAEPIRAVLDALATGQRAAARHQHDVERWCTALLAGDAEALNDFFSRYPGVDRRELQQRVREAAREAAQQRPPRARRVLLRWLRTVVTTGEAAEEDIVR
jgi:ribosome-associated protein